MNRTKQNLALLFAVCCISFAGPLIKVALLFAMPPVAVAFYRLFFSTALLSVPNAKQKGFASFKNLTGKDKGMLGAAFFLLDLFADHHQHLCFHRYRLHAAGFCDAGRVCLLP